MEEHSDLDTLEGHTVLLEAEGTEATGTVTDVGGGALTLTCDQECWPPGESHHVLISVFAPDALYRVTGKATAHGFEVVCAAGMEVERIQRRRWPRKRLDLPVTLCAVDNGVRLSGVPGRTVDLSVGGLCVETIRQLDSTEDPTVILDLPDGTAVVASALLVASEDLGDGWRYRLAFRGLDDSDVERLAQLTAT
jgi:PilZ domain